MELTIRELARINEMRKPYQEALAAVEAKRQLQSLLGGLNPAILRDLALADECREQLEQSSIGQAQRDYAAMKLLYDAVPKIPVPPVVDHVLHTRPSDERRALRAEVESQAARIEALERQLQQRGDDPEAN